MKQPNLYYFELMQMTSQAQSKFTENTRMRLVFSIQNLTRLVTSFLWFQNSVDQAVSQNKLLSKPSVSKHSRIRLSSLFPVCASVDFVHQSSGTIRVSIHIRYTLHTLKRQSSRTVIGKQKVNRFYVIALAA